MNKKNQHVSDSRSVYNHAKKNVPVPYGSGSIEKSAMQCIRTRCWKPWQLGKQSHMVVEAK